MRELTDHKTNAANKELIVHATDAPGSGGAHHRYEVSGFTPEIFQWIAIPFQNGPIKENGVNGLTHEALLAIIIDRLRSFQAGPYASEENKIALDHCEMALAFLHLRTKKREARGVEGTHAI